MNVLPEKIRLNVGHPANVLADLTYNYSLCAPILSSITDVPLPGYIGYYFNDGNTQRRYAALIYTTQDQYIYSPSRQLSANRWNLIYGFTSPTNNVYDTHTHADPQPINTSNPINNYVTLTGWGFTRNITTLSGRKISITYNDFNWYNINTVLVQNITGSFTQLNGVYTYAPGSPSGVYVKRLYLDQYGVPYYAVLKYVKDFYYGNNLWAFGEGYLDSYSYIFSAANVFPILSSSAIVPTTGYSYFSYFGGVNVNESRYASFAYDRQQPTPTPTPTLTPTQTPTNTQTPTQTPTNTQTPTQTPTNTQTPSNTPTNTRTPSNTPTQTPTPTITNVGVQSLSSLPTTDPSSKTSIVALSSFIINPTDDGIFSFQCAHYGPTLSGYEGFSLFFIDTTKQPQERYDGAPLRGLGYSNLILRDNEFIEVYLGVKNGVFGIGFDSSGNFGLSSAGVLGYGKPTPNSVTLRSSFDNKFVPLYRTEDLSNTYMDEPFTMYQQLTGNPQFTDYRIRFTNFGKTIFLDFKNREIFRNILKYDFATALPSIMPAIGFSALSGSKLAVRGFNYNGNLIPLTPTPTPSITPSRTPTQTPTSTRTPTPTKTITPTPSITPSITPTKTVTPTRTPTPTVTPTLPDNRLFYADFANPASYPGTGNSVQNLKSLSNYATLNPSTAFYPITSYGGGMHVVTSNDFTFDYPGFTWNQLGLNNNFTINMWLQLSSYPAEHFRALFSSESYQLSGFRCFLAGAANPAPGAVVFSNGESLSSTDSPAWALQPATVVPLNVPVNLTFTVAPCGGPLGVVASVYMNGMMAASASGNFRSPWNQTIRLFSIGGWKPAECDFFLAEYATGAQPSWQVNDRYNQYAPRFGIAPSPTPTSTPTRTPTPTPTATVQPYAIASRASIQESYDLLKNISTPVKNYTNFSLLCTLGLNNFCNDWSLSRREWNPNFWGYGYRDILNFSGVSLNTELNATLITPQHFISNTHFAPSLSCCFYDHNTGNPVHIRIQDYRNLGNDCYVGKLATPVPAASAIKIYKIAASTTNTNYLQNQFPLFYLGGKAFLTDDDCFHGGCVGSTASAPAASVTCYIDTYSTSLPAVSAAFAGKDFASNGAVGGESSNPIFILLNGELNLYGTFWTPGGGPWWGANSTLAVLTAAIVQMGSEGYSLSAVYLDQYTQTPSATPTPTPTQTPSATPTPTNTAAPSIIAFTGANISASRTNAQLGGRTDYTGSANTNSAVATNWSFAGGNVTATATGIPYHSYYNSAAANIPAVQNYSRTWAYRGGTNVAGTQTTLGGGKVGLWINGISMFNPSAAGGAPGGYTTFANWHYNAAYEAGEEYGYSFGEDNAGAHAAPPNEYHYHDGSMIVTGAWTQGTGHTSVSGVYAVTNSGASAYTINSSSNPTLTLVKGGTYTFNVNANGHPFWIKTAQVTGTGSAYSNGVTNNGTQVGTITFIVPNDAPATLYYICQVHGTMTGIINITNTYGVTGLAECSVIPYYAGSLTQPDGHSKIMGICADGYPVYGPYGYATSTDALGGVRRMVPGYALNPTFVTNNARTPNGTTPPVNATYPLGMFVEDWSFVGGGDLDTHNGRYCVTPDYPGGTYAYFLAFNSDMRPTYPYVIGNTYYGTRAVL